MTQRQKKVVQVWQQHPAEGPGRIIEWASHRGHVLNIAHAWEDTFDGATVSDAVILLGGPYSIDEELPWLKREAELLSEVLVQKSIPVLGICLGAQLLARALGGQIIRMGAMETGWCPIHFASGDVVPALQWHEYGIIPPAGSRTLAHNSAWPCQVFGCEDKHIGIQFHPEWDEATVGQLNSYFKIESPLPRSNDLCMHAAIQRWLFPFLDAWIN
jgi:GMP synthase-like glutamine amidotransferase